MIKLINYSLAKLFRTGLIMVLIYLFVSPYNSYADMKEREKDKGIIQRTSVVQKTADNPITTVIGINNITSYVDSKGFHNSVYGGSWNGTFPKGTAGVVYQEGVVWGGRVNDGGATEIRVGGNTYVSGTSSLEGRTYRVRPDFETASLVDDAASFYIVSSSSVTDADEEEIRAQYETDWLEWPADRGAPYLDADGNGRYEPDRNENGIYYELDDNGDPIEDVPGIAGASQTIWIRYNDDDAVNIYGSPAIGMEVQETYWSYAISNPLQNVIFKKMDLVYVGTGDTPPNSTIDDMYIVQWCDPDVGTYTDDFAGCDTLLNLGYAYNSKTTDATYLALGMAPPAVGYDFLQGVSQYTGDMNDSAMVNLEWKKGYSYVNENPLSTYVYFAAGGTWEDPTLQDYEGTLQWYNLMRGYLPDPTDDLVGFPTPDGGTVGGDGTYLLPGDPVTGTGWIDGQVEGAQDRRICNVTGPFDMAVGDTAEIVVALIGGIGSSNLTSVTVLKYNDKYAQFAYDNLFELPIFPTPTLSFTNQDESVLLNWGDNESLINRIENAAPGGYEFEGYNLYQLPSASASVEDGIKIATYDLVNEVTVILDDELDQETGIILQAPVQVGKNSGISRTVTITEDELRDHALRNGQEYYFALTAYGYNGDETLPYNALESSPSIVTVIPQTPRAGIRYTSVSGDTLEVEHTGTSDGAVYPIVIDPSKVTGDTYKVTFVDSNSTWMLEDVTQDSVLLSNQTNQEGDDNYVVTDGLMVKVLGPEVGINSVTASGTRWVSYTNWGGRYFGGGLDLGSMFFGSDVEAGEYIPIEIRFVGDSVPDVANGWSYGATYWRSDSYAYHGQALLPFTVWDISDPDNPRQINASIVEDANDGSANNQWDMGWDGSAYAANGGREYMFFNNSDYDPTYYDANNDGTYYDVLYAIWPAGRSGYDYLGGEFTLTIVPNYSNTAADEFTFTAPTVDEDAELAKEDLQEVNVFPNPYYGYHYRETARSSKYVTFSHLPNQATIRIFDLSGVLVRTIYKDDNSQFTQWDLTNNNNYPVASGIYVVHVDMPEFGVNKILKLAIIQEEQILDVY